MITCILFIEDIQISKEITHILEEIEKENMCYFCIHHFSPSQFNLSNFTHNNFNVIIFDENFTEKHIQELLNLHTYQILIPLSSSQNIPYYFKYHLYSHLSLPLKSKEIIDLLQDIISLYRCMSGKKISFISNKHILLLNIDDIHSLHYQNRKLYVTTTDEVYQVNGNLKTYKFLCNNNNFRFIRRNLIINQHFKHNKL